MLTARLLLSISFAVLLPARVWASCGAASCPLDTASQERTEQGTMTLGYQWEYVDQDEYRIGTDKANFGQVHGHHDEQYTRTHIQRLSAAVGVTDRLSVEARLPIVSRGHAHVHHHMGAELTESWDLNGAGDLALLSRYTVRKPHHPSQPAVSVILGGEVPTGRTHVSNDDGDEAESGVQPGSHSYDLIAGVSTLQVFDVPTLGGLRAELPVFTSVQAQWNGQGVEDYRLGDAFTFSAGTSYPLTRQFGLTGQVNVLVKDRDGRGGTFEEIGKTGGEFVYLSPGIEWRATEDWRAYAMVQLPVYQRVNSLQLVSDYNVLAGVEYRFQLFGPRRTQSLTRAR